MLSRDLLSRMPRAARLAGIGLAVVAAVVAVLAMIPDSGEIRYEGVPRLERPVPEPAATPAGGGSAPGSPGIRAYGGVAPVDPALIGDGALGAARPYPVSLERIAWAATLDDQGLLPAPASAPVRERRGLEADLGDAAPDVTAARRG